jgi:hypothetical protein
LAGIVTVHGYRETDEPNRRCCGAADWQFLVDYQKLPTLLAALVLIRDGFDVPGICYSSLIPWNGT